MFGVPRSIRILQGVWAGLETWVERVRAGGPAEGVHVGCGEQGKVVSEFIQDRGPEEWILNRSDDEWLRKARERPEAEARATRLRQESIVSKMQMRLLNMLLSAGGIEVGLGHHCKSIRLRIETEVFDAGTE